MVLVIIKACESLYRNEVLVVAHCSNIQSVTFLLPKDSAVAGQQSVIVSSISQESGSEAGIRTAIY
jgi:hypothetical protein